MGGDALLSIGGDGSILSIDPSVARHGSGRGIGPTSRSLARAGGEVVVAARSAEIRYTAEEVGGIAVECDVSDCKSVERMARQVEAAHGRLDLLVSNAGISIEDDASWELHPAEWWRVFEVNGLGVYLCCRSVISAPTTPPRRSTARQPSAPLPA